jgi:hypothetical protein
VKAGASGSGIGLALPLAAMALAMPAPAHAVLPPPPHWYSNGVKIAEGRQVPFVAWGRLSSGSAQGVPIECSNDVAGYLDNPTGGGPGIEVTQAWAAHDCIYEECAFAGGHVGLQFENENSPGADVALNWPGELTEAVAGTVRLKSTNVRVYFQCQFAALAPTEGAGAGPYAGLEERESKEYSLPGADSCTTASPGALQPKLRSGTSAEKPSKIEFSPPGSGEFECGTDGKAIFAGTLKILGDAESEIITASREPVTKLEVQQINLNNGVPELTFLGGAREYQRFVLENRGPQPVEMLKEKIVHTTGGEYATSLGCPKSLPAKSKCEIRIEFLGPYDGEENSTSSWTASAIVEKGDSKGEEVTTPT